MTTVRAAGERRAVFGSGGSNAAKPSGTGHAGS